jgi:hypothetical protein
MDFSERNRCPLHIEIYANKMVHFYFPNSTSVLGFNVDDAIEFLGQVAKMLKTGKPTTVTAYRTWNGVASEEGVVERDDEREQKLHVWDADVVYTFTADQLLQMPVHPPPEWSIPTREQREWGILKKIAPLADYAID